MNYYAKRQRVRSIIAPCANLLRVAYRFAEDEANAEGATEGAEWQRMCEALEDILRALDKLTH